MTPKRRALFLTVTSALLFFIYIWWTNPFQAFSEVGAGFNWGLYLIAVAIDQASFLGWALSWYIILRVMNLDVGTFRTIQLAYTSQFISWILPVPLMTEAVRAYLIKDEGSSNIGKALSSVLVHRAYYNIAFGIIVGTSIVFSVATGEEIIVNPAIAIFLVTFSLASVVFFTLALNGKFLRWISKKIPERIRNRALADLCQLEEPEKGFGPVIEDIEEAIKALKSKKALNLATLLMLIFHWSAGVLTTYLSARAMGISLDLSTTVLAYAAVEFLQQINFFIPSGLGLLDAGLAGALILSGLSISQASAVSLLTRIATYWLEVIVCVPVALSYGYKEFLTRHF